MLLRDERWKMVRPALTELETAKTARFHSFGRDVKQGVLCQYAAFTEGLKLAVMQLEISEFI